MTPSIPKLREKAVADFEPNCMCEDCLEFGWHDSRHAIEARHYSKIIERDMWREIDKIQRGEGV